VLVAWRLWIALQREEITETWDARGRKASLIIPWIAERIPKVDGSKDDLTIGGGMGTEMGRCVVVTLSIAALREFSGGPTETLVGGGWRLRAGSVRARVRGSSTTGEARGVDWSGERETGRGRGIEVDKGI